MKVPRLVFTLLQPLPQARKLHSDCQIIMDYLTLIWKFIVLILNLIMQIWDIYIVIQYSLWMLPFIFDRIVLQIKIIKISNSFETQMAESLPMCNAQMG